MFHVGQQVVCVDDDGTLLLMKGRVYTIVDIFQSLGDTYLALGGVVTETGGRGWYPSRFRPVRKTDISIFTAMLQPVTDKVSA